MESLTRAVAIGDVLAESYRIVERIGAGGMGEVFLAEHLRLPGRHVAIKVLIAVDEASVARFYQEAKATSRLGHPNIVAVIDYGLIDGDRPFIAFEYLHGESLSSRLRRGPFDLHGAAHLLRQIAAGLSAAHSAGIIHRDIKPGNLFLCSAGEPVSDSELSVKILDFGISKVLGSETLETDSAVMLGTPQYMSPEQVAGETVVGAASDVFSLAAIAYELLSGVPPFTGDDVHQVVFSVVFKVPQPIAELVADLPEGVALAIERALEKNPNKRFQTAIGFVRAFCRGAGLELPEGEDEVAEPDPGDDGPDTEVASPSAKRAAAAAMAAELEATVVSPIAGATPERSRRRRSGFLIGAAASTALALVAAFVTTSRVAVLSKDTVAQVLGDRGAVTLWAGDVRASIGDLIEAAKRGDRRDSTIVALSRAEEAGDRLLVRVGSEVIAAVAVAEPLEIITLDRSGKVDMWNDAGELVDTLMRDGASRLGMTASGEVIIVNVGESVRAIDRKSRVELRRWSTKPGDRVSTIGGNRIAHATSVDGELSVAVYDVKTGALVSTRAELGVLGPGPLAFDPKGTRVLTDESLLYSLEGETAPRRAQSLLSSVDRLAFDQHGVWAGFGSATTGVALADLRRDKARLVAPPTLEPAPLFASKREPWMFVGGPSPAILTLPVTPTIDNVARDRIEAESVWVAAAAQGTLVGRDEAGRLSVWSTKTGRLSLRLPAVPGLEKPIWASEAAPLVVTLDLGQAWVWNLAPGASDIAIDGRLRSHHSSSAGHAVIETSRGGYVIDPDAKRVLRETKDGGVLTPELEITEKGIHRIETGELLLATEELEAQPTALLVVSNASASAIGITTREMKARIFRISEAGKPAAELSRVEGVVRQLSDDGARAVISRRDGSAAIVATETGAVVFELAMATGRSGFRLSPDWSRVAVPRDSVLEVYDVESGDQIGASIELERPVFGFAGNTRVITQSAGGVKLIELDNAIETETPVCARSVSFVDSFGTTAAIACSSEVILLDTQTPRVLARIPVGDRVVGLTVGTKELVVSTARAVRFFTLRTTSSVDTLAEKAERLGVSPASGEATSE